ncbi:hypothetical protein TNCV_4664061 [Trichonephila clavipes]|nr:hypothetical protein TNCV_4664061 [Trichonephila clavipes]
MGAFQPHRLKSSPLSHSTSSETSTMSKRVMKSRQPSCLRLVDEESYWLEFKQFFIPGNFFSSLTRNCSKAVAMATE